MTSKAKELIKVISKIQLELSPTTEIEVKVQDLVDLKDLLVSAYSQLDVMTKQYNASQVALVKEKEARNRPKFSHYG